MDANTFFEGITPDAEIELREAQVLLDQRLDRITNDLERIVSVLEFITRETGLI